MVGQLVSLLGGAGSKLPLCIRVIGYLRRLEVFPEPELRVAFLQQKDVYFQSLLADIREGDHTEYLKKYIEVSRECFFDIITQYKAIFSDISAAGGLVGGSPATSPTALSSSYSLISPNLFHPSTASLSTSNILASYATHIIQSLHTQLTTRLPMLPDTASLHSVCTQYMYYGQSLGRLGLDFRLSLVDAFVDGIKVRVWEVVNSGCAGFAACKCVNVLFL